MNNTQRCYFIKKDERACERGLKLACKNLLFESVNSEVKPARLTRGTVNQELIKNFKLHISYSND